MPTFDYLFIIIISILVLSVILSIIDWIYLTTLATRVTLLDREVEKRSQEFDTLKKERQSDITHPSGVISVIESNEPLSENITTTTTTKLSDEDTIQIVRNIRGTFETSEPTPPNPMKPDQQILPAEPADMNQFPGNASLPPSDAPIPEHAAPHSPIIHQTEHDLSGTRYTTAEVPELLQPISDQPAVLKLFSDSSKDADFRILWQNVNHILNDQQSPHITIDFNQIHFIYEKEMEYLEKMYYLIAGQGGSLSLINCDEELITLLNNNTLLRSIVKNKVV
jgi:hypothetical protein